MVGQMAHRRHGHEHPRAGSLVGRVAALLRRCRPLRAVTLTVEAWCSETRYHAVVTVDGRVRALIGPCATAEEVRYHVANALPSVHAPRTPLYKWPS